MRNKLVGLLVIGLLGIAIAGCGGDAKEAPKSSGKATVLKVAATPVPHAEILNIVKPLLAKDGIELQIIEFTDYVKPNLATSDKEVDANFFQHKPYLDKFVADRGLKLSSVAAIHIEPMGVYSRKLKSLSDIESGSTIAIPNDPSNGGRALMVLERAGLLKLKEGVGVNATPRDIVDNPKNLKIVEIEAPQLPRSLDDVAAAVINTNFALEAKLNPTKDALFMEPKDSPYANILVIRTGDESRPEIKKLIAALQSHEVRKFIEEKYQGAIVPAF